MPGSGNPATAGIMMLASNVIRTVLLQIVVMKFFISSLLVEPVGAMPVQVCYSV